MKKAICLFFISLVLILDSRGQSNLNTEIYKPLRVGVHLQYPGQIENFQNGLGFGVDLIFIDSGGNTSALISGSYSDTYSYKQEASSINFDSNLKMYTFRLGLSIEDMFTPFISVTKLESDVELSSNQESILGFTIKDEPKIGVGAMLRFPFPNNSAFTIKIEYNSSIEGFGGSIGFQL